MQTEGMGAHAEADARDASRRDTHPHAAGPTHCRVPIVLVPGFLGPSRDDEDHDERRRVFQYWGEAQALGSPESQVICVWPGGLSSLHDRACEIFYQIKGGVVDYGEDHSLQFGHARFGRKYRGSYTSWSRDFPIHVVGHSLGGSTVRMLQHLLHVRAFPGHDTTSDWIVSLTAINAPLNGSLSAYALGEREDRAPEVVSMSPGSLLGSIVHIFAFLDCKIFGFDLGMDFWNLSWKGSKRARGQRRSWREFALCLWCALQALVSSLLVRSPVVESEDNAAYDVSVHGMARCNALVGIAHDRTYYISLVGDGSEGHRCPARLSWRQWRAFPSWIICSLQCCFRRVFLAIIAQATARRRYWALATSLGHVEGFHVDHYSGANDGLVSVFSQSHPRVGVECEAWRVRDMPDKVADMERGVWHVMHHRQDHMGIVPFPASAERQRQLFHDLFRRLHSLPLEEPRPDACRARRLAAATRRGKGTVGVVGGGEAGRTASAASAAETDSSFSSDNLVLLEALSSKDRAWVPRELGA